MIQADAPNPATTLIVFSLPLSEGTYTLRANIDGQELLETINVPSCTQNPIPPTPESACAGTGGRNIAITGTNGPDTIFGTNGRNTINGLAGNDAINACGGNDVVNGNTDNDGIAGGPGNDDLHGNMGNDIVRGDAGNDDLFGDEGVDTMTGGPGNDDFVCSPDGDIITDFNTGGGRDRMSGNCILGLP